MTKDIGQLIKEVAENQGLSQQQFGKKINRTKQGAANIYKRSTIDTELLRGITGALNHDFFAYYYEEEPLKSFREKEIAEWTAKIDNLNRELSTKDQLLAKNEEILSLQRKYIAELEAKVARLEGDS